jgi:acetoacetyl-CoA reductase
VAISNGNGNGNGTAALKGRVALVTGAGRGIGRAIALELAHRGAAIAVNYRHSKTEAESLEDEILAAGADCMLVQGDVASSEQAHRIVKTVVDAWKRLDILVNNAGITRDKSLRKMADDEWADVINVNLNGTYYCTSAAIPVMVEQKFGRIINISSYVGQAGNFGQANYAASKGGMIAFTKAVAIEMAKYNITVNAIAPGFTCTEMLANIPPNVLDQIRAKIPMGRLARPEEIAKAAGFLASEGDYITGQQLNVNGGIYM